MIFFMVLIIGIVIDGSGQNKSAAAYIEDTSGKDRPPVAGK